MYVRNGFVRKTLRLVLFHILKSSLKICVFIQLYYPTKTSFFHGIVWKLTNINISLCHFRLSVKNYFSMT